jgi:transcription antitermination factor NusG
VVQLTSLGEREKNIDIITRAVRRILGEIDVFVPAVVQKVREESHTMVYMDGYVFVKFVEGVNYLKLQETTFFKCVLCTPGSNGRKTYHLLDNFVLDKMRDGVKGLKTSSVTFSNGQDVKVTKGTYKDLRGKVIDSYADGTKVQVHLYQLLSKPVIIEFPPGHLEKTEAS